MLCVEDGSVERTPSVLVHRKHQRVLLGDCVGTHFLHFWQFSSHVHFCALTAENCKTIHNRLTC